MTGRAGTPVVVALTAGQRHERPRAIPLLEQATARMWPEAGAGDKGARGSAWRTGRRARAIDAVIADREDASGDPASDREADRERPTIARAINRLTRLRRIAARDDTLASSDLAMVTIAMILEWRPLCRQTLVDLAKIGDVAGPGEAQRVR